MTIIMTIIIIAILKLSIDNLFSLAQIQK